MVPSLAPSTYYADLQICARQSRPPSAKPRGWFVGTPDLCRWWSETAFCEVESQLKSVPTMTHNGRSYSNSLNTNEPREQVLFCSRDGDTISSRGGAMRP
jgi:hypothetical protein